MAIIIGKDSDNNLIGTNRDDWVFGLGGNDTLSGGNGSDKLFGGNGNDSIAGGAGNDWIVGGSGNDSLVGGSGADQLIGGSGQDHFVYLLATDSPAAAGWDRILDFTQGQDKIDLAAFRNNSSDLDLVWRGEDPAVPGAWGVWYHNGPTSTSVYADTNGDGIADLKIELKNTCGLNLVASDFIGVSEAQVNVAPVLDLDANNSAAAGANYATTFTENGSPVAIADADVGITDVDDTHIVSASITLANPQIGDSLVAGALPTGITVGAASTATHIILTGSATLADYQVALRAITFSNSSENPDTTARDVTVVVNDGDANSNTAHTAIAVVAVNDAPTSSDASEATSEDTPVTLGLDDFGSYSDVEGTAIAAVKITTLASDGSLQYDTGSSTWTLVTLNQEISATDINAGRLRFVPDANENGTPYATVGFQVSDGTDFSTNAYTLTLNVTAVNDAPVVTDDVLSSVAEDSGTRTIDFAELTGNDSNGDAEVAQGLIVSAVSNAVGGTVALVGGHVEFTPTVDFNGVASFDYTVQDDGTTNGVLDAKSDIGQASFTVTAFNDPPTVAGLVVTETSISFVASDVDNATLSLASPFATAFGNPTITSDAITALTPAQQAPAAVSGTLQVTDGTATANVVRLYLGTNGNDLATLPLAGSPTAIYGFAGADSLAGGTGADSLYGGTGNDLLDGGGTLDTGNDTLLGGLGNDALFQTKGNDSIDGGGDFDTLLFNDGVGGGVNVNLATHVSTHGANVATVTAIENVTGTAGDDTLTGGDPTHAPDLLGNGVLESFRPLGGNDTITGATGNGFITRADYSTSTSAVAVNLGTGTASDGFGGTDTLVRVDQVFGGSGNDTLLGGSQERSNSGHFLEQFRGGAGNDLIDGAGTDTVVGAAGNNQVRYIDSPAAVSVNLGTGTASDGFGGTDTLLNINSVLGSNFNDTLVGGASDHRLIGGVGNDMLVGVTSGVEARYNNATGAVNVSLAIAGPQAVGGGEGIDTLTNIDDLSGSVFNDTLIGNAANNRLAGDPGADTLDGGGGIDFASYNGTPLANGGIDAFIESGAGSVDDGVGSTDTLTNIEGLIGSHSNDTLAGGLGDQWFIGRGGSDSITGGAGNDWVSYINDPAGVTVNLGSGSATDGWGGVWGFGGTDTLVSIENVEGSQFNDSITGDASANRLEGQGGNDTIDGGAGDDTVKGGAGADSLVGGADSDTLSYENSPTRVIVNMLATDPITVSGIIVQAGTAVEDFLSPLPDTTDTISGFETVVGSAFSDFLVGTSNVANRLEGGAGNDTLVGSGLSDGIMPPVPGAANDTLLGGSGDDELRQTRGADHIDGGAGFDRLVFVGNGINYVGSTGVSVNLATGTSDYDTSDAGNPLGTLVSIEQVNGTAGNDSFVGGDPAHAPDFLGNRDAEVFRPLGGDDTITGATGNGFFTRVDYSTNTNMQAVSVNLGTGTASDGFGFTDTLVRIDEVIGGAGNDSLLGGGQERGSGGGFREVFRGNSGNDTIDGAGTDTVVGAAGNDRVQYNSSPAAVIVNLMSGTASDGFGFTDTLFNIDEVQGSNFNDTLTGGGEDHRLIGGAGNDSLVGGTSGVEASYIGGTPAGVNANLALGTASDGFGGTDTLVNIDDLRGSDFNDTLTGSAASNVIIGEPGADIIDGGGGIDFASYSSTPLANGGINALIENGSGAVNDGMGSIDTLTNIEGLIGTHSGDTLTGGSGDQWFRGRGGSDVINGGDGNDGVSYINDPAGVTVNLGAPGSATDGWGGVWGFGGTDTLISIENVEGSQFNDSITGDANANVLDGGAGNDTLEGGASNDFLTGGEGIDTLSYDDSPSRVIVNMFVNDSITIGGITVDPGHAFDGFTPPPVPIPAPTDTISGFETVIGSAFSDYIQGSTNVANLLVGGAGNDTLAGSGSNDGIMPPTPGAANDTLVGGPGNDVLRQSRGNDVIDGGEGSSDALNFLNNGIVYGGAIGVNVNLEAGTSDADPNDGDGVHGAGGDVSAISGIERVDGTAGNDSLVGGDPTHAPDSLGNGIVESFLPLGGNDTITGATGNGFITRAEYSSNTAGQAVIVNLGATPFMVGMVTVQGGTAHDGFGGTDTLVRVDQVFGGSGNDTLLGGSQERSNSGHFLEQFRGGAGNDLIDGAGTDTVVGAAGNNQVRYIDSPTAVSVNLGTGTASDGFGGTDTLLNINSVLGSNFNDTLVGGASDHRLIGGVGNDMLVGVTSGVEARYNNATGAVNVSLAIAGPQAVGGGEGIDTLTNIDDLSGSVFNDTLIGNAANNRLAGDPGADTLDGGGGIDFASYNGTPLANGGIDAFIESGAGSVDDGVGSTDTLTNIEGLIGSHSNDTLAGGLGDQWFIGRGGSDSITGGAGNDWVSYINDPAGVTVNLGSGSATDGWGGVWGFGGTDTLVSIENVEGSQFNDSITGDALANRITGLGGNDTLDGGAGNDTLDGGAGNDTLNGGDGDDRIERGSDLGLDRVDGGAGSDTLVLRNTLGIALPPTLIEDGATYNARLGLTLASPGFVDPTHIAVSGGLPLGLTVDAVGVEHIEIIGGDAGGTLTINGDFSLTDLEPTTITATGGAGADTLNASGVTSAHRIVANGGSGGDSAIGGAGNDLLNGAAGDDTLEGGEGNDYLLGGDGVDSLFGGAGDDLISSGGGADHVDGGEGIDTVQRRGATSGTTTDLSTGTSSGGDTLLNIENVSGSVFGDTMIGSDGANVLSGWEGFDSLTGGNGNDQLLGESGDDTLIGGAGADTLDGGSTPGNPNDTDLVSYFYASSAVTVNLGAGTGAVSLDPADTDTISNIEMVGGSAFADMLTGGNTANDDFERFEGRGGNDIIDGGSGFDEVFYLSAPGFVTVDLSTGSASDGEGGTDSLFNIEAIRSSNFADILTGDANNNRFRGQAGSDMIDGGAGIDEADYRSSTSSGVIANVSSTAVTYNVGVGEFTVAAGTALDGHGGGGGSTDTLTSIENLRGSNLNDALVGNSVANRLRGEAGNDTLIGNEGNDTLEGASGDEFLQGGAGNDVINGGENAAGLVGDSDTASFEDAGIGVTVNLALGSATIGAETDTLIDIERVIGTDFADTLIGGDPKNIGTGDSEQFEGRGGNDTIDGGSGGVGSDWALYTSAPAGVVVDLIAGSALNDGYGTIDTLVNIDRVRGSAFADQIYGSNSPGGTNERFEGMAGNDIIDGRGGFDYLHYQSGTAAGVIVNLDTFDHFVGADIVPVLAGTARDGFDSDPVTPGVQSYTDTFFNIEGVRGSGFADTFFGSNNAPFTTEAFEGMGGFDTIDGGGGFDRLEYGRSTSGVSVNLASGTASDGLGGFDNFINIEAVRGSIFNDSLTGDAGNNILEGREGGDFLTGGAGNDTLNGGEEPGNQLPQEIDVVNYGNTGAVTGVTVDLELGTATDGLGGTDTLIDIENVRGTEFSDMLRGGNPTNSFSGTSEQFEGRGGNDTIDGGIGNDWAIYLNAAAGVHVDLAAGLAFNDGDGGVDTLVSIDRVRGSHFDDLIFGSDNPEGTNERFDGRRGHDYIDGRGGLDYAQFNGSPSGVVVDLQLGIAIGDNGQTDTLVNIEGVRASNFADLLYGSDNATGFEAFEGQGGNDIIDGRGGIDRVEYLQSDAGVSVNLATGTASDGFGATDTFVNIEGVRGSHHDDQLTGNSGDNTLEGQEGNDILVGAGGTDSMTGSAGIDTFRFAATSDSSAILSFSDVITDFVHGTDKIDLSAIDAVVGIGDEPFLFGGSNLDTVANSVTWSEDVANMRTILHIDNTGDTTADMQIVLQGTSLGLTDADFVL